MELEWQSIWQTALLTAYLPRIILTVALIVGAVVLWRLLSRAYTAAAQKSKKKATAVSSTAIDVVKAVYIIVVALLLLQMNGVNVGGMLTGLGIASAIVGLALQDMLRDILMGIRIVSDKFFDVGDVVCYEGRDAVVVSYNLRTTKLRGLDYPGEMTVCNRNITQIEKKNNTLLLNVPLSYEEDFHKVHDVLTAAAEEMTKIAGVKKAQYAGTQSLNDSSITYRIHLTIDMTKKWDVYRAALMLLQERLAENQITIPYPQLDVHTK